MEVVLARTSPLTSPACHKCRLSLSVYIPDEHAALQKRLLPYWVLTFIQAAMLRHVCSLRSSTARSALRLTIHTQY